eukprot:COSAG02_NODE_6332_length_3645_cov_3.053582_2_plen_89_part_00
MVDLKPRGHRVDGRRTMEAYQEEYVIWPAVGSRSMWAVGVAGRGVGRSVVCGDIHDWLLGMRSFGFDGKVRSSRSCARTCNRVGWVRG